MQLARPDAAQQQQTWMIKEMGLLHDEVSSSFSKEREKLSMLQHNVMSTQQQAEARTIENCEKQARIQELEVKLARDGELVQRLRDEHAALEAKNKGLVEEEKQLQAQREDEKNRYCSALRRAARQIYAARAAIFEVNKSPEFVDEMRMQFASFDDLLGKLVHCDAFDMIREAARQTGQLVARGSGSPA